MNIPGHPPPSSPAGSTPAASRPLPQREQELLPYMQLHDTLGRPYPAPLLRQIEAAVLGREGMYVDEDFFATTANILASILQSITADCAMETFWDGIRSPRLQLDVLFRTGCSEVGMVRNRPRWLLTDFADTAPGRTFTVPPLQQLALDRIAETICGTRLLANRIATHRTTMALALLHNHISEFTADMKQRRPDLWELSGPLDHNVSTHINAARSIIANHSQADLTDSPDLLRGVFNMLSWARLHACHHEDALSAGLMSNSEIRATIAIEEVYQHIASLFSDSPPPLPAWPPGTVPG